MRIQDYDSFDGDTTDGESVTLTVDTRDKATTEVLLFIDDGTPGNVPAQYDLEQHVDVPGGTDDFRFYDEVSGETARSWSDPVVGEQFRNIVTNVSGATATYRAIAVALGEN